MRKVELTTLGCTLLLGIWVSAAAVAATVDAFDEDFGTLVGDNVNGLSGWSITGGIDLIRNCGVGGSCAGLLTPDSMTTQNDFLEGTYLLSFDLSDENLGVGSLNYGFDSTSFSVSTTAGAGWQNIMQTFTLAGGEQLWFSHASGSRVLIDNIEVSVVPLPAAAWLFATALGLLGWIRRRTA